MHERFGEQVWGKAHHFAKHEYMRVLLHFERSTKLLFCPCANDRIMILLFNTVFQLYLEWGCKKIWLVP